MKTVLIKASPHLFVLLIFAAAFLVYNRKSDEAIARLASDYPALTIEESVAAKVIAVYCPPELRCAGPPVHVVLNNDKKQSITAHQSTDGAVTLVSFITVGDSLVKDPNNDTLKLYRGDQIRTFIVTRNL